MFGNKKNEGENDTQQQETAASTEATAVTRADAPQNAPRASAPTLARRVVEIPGSSRRSSASAAGDERKLTVGKGLSLAGEITSCDVLVVEGKVEAKLTDGKMLEITESGQFRGSVEIENADIAGRYDGQLVVHGRLTVRASGRISGMVKYGELEVSAGGQIIGEMQVAGGGSQQSGTGNFKNAARYAASSSDENEEGKNKSDRKSA